MFTADAVAVGLPLAASTTMTMQPSDARNKDDLRAAAADALRRGAIVAQGDLDAGAEYMAERAAGLFAKLDLIVKVSALSHEHPS